MVVFVCDNVLMCVNVVCLFVCFCMINNMWCLWFVCGLMLLCVLAVVVIFVVVVV